MNTGCYTVHDFELVTQGWNVKMATPSLSREWDEVMEEVLRDRADVWAALAETEEPQEEAE